MATKSPPAQESLHVLVGDSAGGSLKVAEFNDTFILRDPLCSGPCDEDPTRHLRKRRDWILEDLNELAGPKARLHKKHAAEWASILIRAREFARQVAREGKKRSVVLWTTPTWVDQVPFWWMLDALQRARVKLENLWWVNVVTTDYPPSTLGTIPPEDLIEAFSAVQPLARKTVAKGTALWRMFANRSPLRFDQARRTDPALRESCEPLGAFVPRTGGKGAIRLCQLDQDLFDALESNQWLHVVDLIKKSRSLCDYILPFGGLLLLRRLRQWARTPALSKRANENCANELTAMSYQLTPQGEQIRDVGLETLDEAPPLLMGGFRFYVDPWVRRNRGRSWWIEELSGAPGQRRG
jgi:hypothetical protein